MKNTAAVTYSPIKNGYCSKKANAPQSTPLSQVIRIYIKQEQEVPKEQLRTLKKEISPFITNTSPVCNL